MPEAVPKPHMKHPEVPKGPRFPALQGVISQGQLSRTTCPGPPKGSSAGRGRPAREAISTSAPGSFHLSSLWQGLK
jgi:hypothetical protein